MTARAADADGRKDADATSRSAARRPPPTAGKRPRGVFQRRCRAAPRGRGAGAGSFGRSRPNVTRSPATNGAKSSAGRRRDPTPSPTVATSGRRSASSFQTCATRTATLRKAPSPSLASSRTVPPPAPATASDLDGGARPEALAPPDVAGALRQAAGGSYERFGETTGGTHRRRRWGVAAHSNRSGVRHGRAEGREARVGQSAGVRRSGSSSNERAIHLKGGAASQAGREGPNGGSRSQRRRRRVRQRHLGSPGGQIS